MNEKFDNPGEIKDHRLFLQKIKEQSRLFWKNNAASRELFDFIKEIIIVTNKDRQIIYANKAMLSFISAKSADDITGLKPGEAFQCVHACSGKYSCGASEYCDQCGSVFSLLAGQQGHARFHDFSLLRCSGDQTESLDLSIFACPVIIEGETFFFFTIADISHEKRREALERIFFHDILNIAGGLHGLSILLKNGEIENEKEIFEMFYLYSDYLIREIEAQKILRSAERNDLAVEVSEINADDLLQNVVNMYLYQDVAKNKSIKVIPCSEKISFVSDKTLISRVIGNMIKNALEASSPGDTVTVECEKKNEKVEIRVYNPSAMPEKVQMQVFKRSFSTKGAGRGLGTYGMKLLSEKYLQGEVSFSSGEKGTVFRAIYPNILSKPKK